MTHYDRTNPRARKSHRCGSCLMTIQSRGGVFTRMIFSADTVTVEASIRIR